MSEMHRIIKKKDVRVDQAQPALPAGATGATGAAGAPAPHGHRGADEFDDGLRLLRVDGRVRALEHRCHCGRTTVIEIEYEDDRGAAA